MTDNGLVDAYTAAGAFVLTGEHACHACGCIVPVHTLLAVGPFADLSDDADVSPDDTSVIVRGLAELPPSIAGVAGDESGGRFRPDYSRTAEHRYVMNHCRECDAKIGDWFVHRPGEAFFPTTDDELARVRGRFVPGPHRFAGAETAWSSWTDDWLANQPR